jgi:preprotein translocase subunit SecB
MTETEQPPLVINGQYVKDLSFEAPGAPGIFAEMADRQPEIPINIDIQARVLAENVYEVVLVLKIDARLGETPCFLVELSYGGVFTLNVAQEHVQPILLIECTRMLFPFARQIVADVSRQGGFPPLMLQPIDFAALYRQRMEAEGQMQNPQGNA